MRGNLANNKRINFKLIELWTEVEKLKLSIEQ